LIRHPTIRAAVTRAHRNGHRVQGFKFVHQGAEEFDMSNGFETSAQIVRDNDAMTAGGQLSRASTTNLPPPAFRINIPVMPMRVPGSHPYRVLTGRDFIPSWLPGICMPVPAMITSDPDMPRTRSDSAMLMDADRGSKFYDDLRMCRTEAECDSDECVEKDFHISPSYIQAGKWPMRGKRLR
jgi:hypothetical protein